MTDNPKCVETLDMYGRIVTVEANMRSITDRLNRTETHLHEEITALKKTLEAIMTQINKLELKIMLIIGGATTVATLVANLITILF